MRLPGITDGPSGPLQPLPQGAPPEPPSLEKALREALGPDREGPTFLLLSTPTCPWCDRARAFLGALAGSRPVRVVEVDANERPDLFWAVAGNTGRRTVPQVFLDRHYVGGWSELAEAARSGKLDAYLDRTGGEPGAPGGADDPAWARDHP